LERLNRWSKTDQGEQHPKGNQEDVQVIVGLRDKFAIESVITTANSNLGQRGLGHFLIYVNGHRYGVDDPEATMLAVSFDEVGRRFRERGRHTAPFSKIDVAELASALVEALYDADSTRLTYFGMPSSEFERTISGNRLMWAPDGDEAFDDGSWVFQFDVDDRVRLIAFRRLDSGSPDPMTLSELWLSSDEFYRVLEQWHSEFETEWSSFSKSLRST
jgi:hypothetical protein